MLRKAKLLVALVGGALVIGAQSGAAQSADDLKALRNEVQGLKDALKTVQSDLQEIKNLLRARPSAGPGAPAGPAQEVVFSLEGAPVKGENGAKVVMMEFTDYQ